VWLAAAIKGVRITLLMTMKRSAQETNIGLAQYKWQFQQDTTRDIGVYEITRSTDTVPHTVLIHRFSTRGPRQLFSDIFYSDDWDADRGNSGIGASDDVRFLCELWKELGLKEQTGEDFQPKHVTEFQEPDRYPTVYRNALENVMTIKYGCGHTDIVHDVAVPDNSTSNNKVIPLVFDINDSQEVMMEKVHRGIKEAMHADGCDLHCDKDVSAIVESAYLC